MLLRSLIPIACALALGACNGESDAGPPPDPGEGLVLLPPEGGAVGPAAELGIRERNEFHDFGDVPDGEQVEHRFRLENRSPAPIRILTVTPDCGCTVPLLTTTDGDGAVVQGRKTAPPGEALITVAPGALLALDVLVDTRDVKTKNTDKLMTVRVATDAPATRFVTLEMHVLVQRPLNVTPEVLDFSRVPENGGGVTRVDLVQVGNSGVRVGELLSVPDGVQAEILHETRFGHDVWVLEARLLPPIGRGRHSGVIQVGTVTAQGTPYRPLDVGYTAFVVGDVQADPGRLVLVLEPGATGGRAEVEVFSLIDGHYLRVTDVALDDELAQKVDATFEPSRNPTADGTAKRWRIALAASASFEAGVVHGHATVRIDDDVTPELELPVIVNVR